MLSRDRFILLYAAAVTLTALILSLLSVQALEIYYSVYLIEFLVLLELIGPFKKSMNTLLQPLVLAFLLGFAYIVIQRVLEILT
jgi:hypothetical protein